MSGHQQHLLLDDGRRLAYAEHGDPPGTPVLYFHGTPSSSVEWQLWDADDHCRQLGLRLVTVDRPGVGGSEHDPTRRMSSWPLDVAALADHLKLGRFAVLGYSGGCPYALACAALLPDRVTHVVLVGVIGPFDEPGLTDAMPPKNLKLMETCRDRPAVGRLILRLMALLARAAPRRFVQQALAALPTPDQNVLADTGYQSVFLEVVRDAQRSGPAGAQHDMALMAGPWEFDPAAGHAPVLLWHGDADHNATLAMARHLDAAIPLSTLKIQEGEGHLSIVTRHGPAILTAIADHHRARPNERGSR